MPRVPSGGALPGPRQRAQSPVEDVIAITAKPKKGGMLQSGLQIEHEEKLQSMQLSADMNTRQLQAQQAENKRLRKRMDQLLKTDGDAGDSIPEDTLPAPSFPSDQPSE